tara:strand:+ start:301 stop:1302 length:1002 start_codon:yes stop_codon:yes gene_type:complete
MMSLHNIQQSIGFWVIAIGVLTSACEKEITVDLPDSQPSYVVEGSIASGEPPFVFLTTSQPFFGSQSFNDLEGLFVHNATMVVSDDAGNSTSLNEWCISDLAGFLTNEELAFFLEEFGLEPSLADSAEVPNVCVYTLDTNELINYFTSGNASVIGTEGRSYTLDIITEEGSRISAVDYMVPAISPDSLTWEKNSTIDTLAVVYVHLTIPDFTGNQIIYQTARNDEPFYRPTQAVWDDRIFGVSGAEFSLPLERAYTNPQGEDIETFGYFVVGDTVYLQWSNITRPIYDFWSSIQNDGGDTPFTAPVQVNGNVEGALGVWACYTHNYLDIICSN